MSGLVKGIKKVFKKVTDVVKKVAPIALVVGAAALTLGAGSGLLGAAGTATQGVAGVSSAVSAGSGGGFIKSFLANSGLQSVGGAVADAAVTSAAEGTIGSLFSKALASPMFGQALGGAARGYMQAQGLEAEQDYIEKERERRSASYEGVGDAMRFDLQADLGDSSLMPAEGSIQTKQDRGLGGTGEVQQAEVAQSTKAPSVPITPAAGGTSQKYKYNPETKRIEYV